MAKIHLLGVHSLMIIWQADINQRRLFWPWTSYTTKFIHLVSHYRRVATASLRVLFYLALTTHVLGLNHGCLFKSEIVKKTQGHKDKNAPPETILPHCS